MRQTIHQRKKGVTEEALMTMYVNDNKIVFDPDLSQTLISSKLLIDRNSHRLSELKSFDKGDMKSKPVFGVIGTLKIYGKNSVIYIEDAEFVCMVGDSPTYQIKKVGIMMMDTIENDERLDQQEKEFIQQLAKVLQTNFYFSYQCDLTQTSERRHKILNQSYQQSSLMQMKQNTQKYWWNYYMLRNFLRDSISEFWMIKVIQGYVGAFNTTLKTNKHLGYVLISRRSSLRPGNFQDHCGVDDDGNVANHVETEQRIFYDTVQTSFVMVRGSVPLQWRKVQLNKTKHFTKEELESSKKYLSRHFNSLIASYNKIACVNLLSKVDGASQILSQNFEQLHQEGRFENVGFEHIDFDSVCKTSFDGLNAYLEKMNPIITYFGYFLHDVRIPKTKFQKGVFRLNCLDCLDRTNIYMTKIAMKVTQDILEELGIVIETEFNTPSLVQDSQHPFLIYFKSQWAESGDNIAKYYHSNIDITSILKTPDKCLKKFFKMNMDDQIKADVIDQMLGNHHQTSTSLQNIAELEQQLKQRENEFLRTKPIQVYAVTWNINAHTPNLNDDFSALLKFQEPPELIAIGFQELVKLNAVNVVGNMNQLQIETWRTLIENVIKQHFRDEYVIVTTGDLVGCFLMILVRRDQQNQVTQVETDTVKCGFGSQLGNKGGVLVRMHFYDSVITFIDVHLPAGQKKADARLQAIEDIHTKAFQKRGVFENSDWTIFMGDTNFRINLTYYQGIQYVAKIQDSLQSKFMDNAHQMMSVLRENDQLKIEKQKSPYLKLYQEHDINFLPTYKFDIGCNNYDTSKKQRVPSWTDRILFHSSGRHIYKPLTYECLRGPFNCSDHRPVASLIQTSISYIYQSKRDEILEEIFRNYSQEDQKWADKFFDRMQLIKRRSRSSFDFTPATRKNRMQQVSFSQLVMEEVQVQRSTVPHFPNRAAGKRKMPDLEEITRPFDI